MISSILLSCTSVLATYENQMKAPWYLAMLSHNENQYNYPDTAGKRVIVYIVDHCISNKFLNTHDEILLSKNFGCNSYNNNHGELSATLVNNPVFGVAKEAKVIAVGVYTQNPNFISSAANNVLSFFNPPTHDKQYAEFVNAINWIINDAERRDIKAVINLSLSLDDSKEVEDKISDAIHNNIVVVKAAGNENTNACDESLNRVQGVIVVGAIKKNLSKWKKSNYGECVTLFAPGHGIHIDKSIPSIIGYRGTSISAAIVSGVAAVYLSVGCTANNVLAVLKGTAISDSIKDESCYGTGCLKGSPNKIVQIADNAAFYCTPEE
eukprot:NODE_194_length_15414_cov_0.324127.p5 type:complete len:323 gc:universal NODE_194_length_15414_cov_0.324127:2660-3628(+)